MKRVFLTLVFVSLVSFMFVSSAFAAGELGLGMISSSGLLAPVAQTVPSIRFKFTPNFTGDAGLMIQSSGGDSSFGIALRGAISVAKTGGVDMYIPFGIDYLSDSGADRTYFVLKGGWGAETYVKSNFSVGFDLYPIVLVSPSEGDSTLTLLGGGAIMAHYYF